MPNDVTVSVSGAQGVSVAVSGQTGPTATLVAGGAAVVTVMDGATAWADLTGKPSTFAPSAHAASHASGGADAVTVAIGQVTGLQSALDAKATPGDVTAAVAAVVDAAPAALDTLNELAAALGDDANFATTITNALAAKAPINSPTFTGTVGGITKSMVGLGNVDNTSDASKPISTATQTALDGKAGASDSRLTDSREWSAATVTQAEAEAGTSTNRLAFSPLRVFQAVAAWWSGSAAKAKLDGIATGATANATDAQLRDRSTHTGLQLAATISDFTTAVVAAAPPTTDASLLTTGTLSASRLTDATTTTKGGVIVGSGLGVASGTVSVTYGASSGTACQGNDSRLSDSRSPTAHTHAASDITSGTIATARLGSGLADATTFLRGDGTFAVPSASVPYATTAQAQDLTATTVAMNPANIRSSTVSWLRIGNMSTYTLNGGSASGTSPLAGSVQTSSSVANSVGAVYFNNSVWSSTSTAQGFDWSKPASFYMRFRRQTMPSTGVFRSLFGQMANSGYAWETLSGRGIGFEVRLARIWMVVHNGTTLSTVDTGIDSLTADYAAGQSEVWVRSDAAGNVTLTHTLNGVTSTFTTTGGPSTLSGSVPPTPYAAINNLGTASQGWFMFTPHLLNIT